MRGCVLRVERKASREPQGIRHMQSRTMLSSAANTPVRSEHIEGQKQSMANLPSEPATPSHTVAVDTATPSPAPSSQVPQGSAYGMAPLADQNYSTPSSYGGPSYQANPPAGTETFPATPQATPGMLSPLASYYHTPYSWMTPYLQDPNFAAMYYGGGYSPSPMGTAQGAPGAPGAPGASGASGAGHNDDGGEDAATPTKHSSGIMQRLGAIRTRSENS